MKSDGEAAKKCLNLQTNVQLEFDIDVKSYKINLKKKNLRLKARSSVSIPKMWLLGRNGSLLPICCPHPLPSDLCLNREVG